MKEMQPKVAAEVRAAASAESCLRDADIVATTTNSLLRVIDPDWVKPGMHVTCVRVPELGEETIRKVDRLIIHSHKHAPKNYVAGFGAAVYQEAKAKGAGREIPADWFLESVHP